MSNGKLGLLSAHLGQDFFARELGYQRGHEVQEV